MFFRIIIVILVAAVAVLTFTATRPNTLRVSRFTVINASPETVFALINDFHSWSKWAPQDREDPTLARSYSGAASGVGAISTWEGAGSAGRGRMAITESHPNTSIVVTVDFVKPFKAHNLNRFTLEPTGNSTKISWTMEGTNVFVSKVMSVFVNMDKMMGKHFEMGLDDLKRIAEE